MKIAAISDTHGVFDGLDPSGCEICVIAGDFSKHTGFGHYVVRKQYDWIRDKFFSWTRRFPDTTFIVVAGNHDLCLDPDIAYRYPDCQSEVYWPDNVKYLCDSGVNVLGLNFYGTPWVPIINFRWAFEADGAKLRSQFSKIPENADILITHTPPRVPDYFGDISLEYGVSSEHFGSHELADAIFEKCPKYVFCGHIHSGSHDPFVFNKSVIQNVSRVDESYNVKYELTVVEV